MTGTALGFGALGFVAVPAPAQAQSSTIELNIPAQPLASALRAFAQQSGIQIAYRTAIAAGAQAPALRGSLTANQALGQLLAGSGLGYRFTGAGAVTILANAQGAGIAPVDGAVVLEPVNLAAGAEVVTEGSGSYTTGESRGATGLPLSLRETPQSMTVVTRQRISDQGLKTTQEVLAYATGVNSATFETDRDNVWSRGQWVSSYIIDGVVVDGGIGFMSGAGVHSSSDTYDRVDVVRGATGLLTGTGDPSAAVRMTRKQANSREFTGSVNLRFGTWDRAGLGVDLGGALNADGSLRGRVVADVSTGGSFRDRYKVKKQTLYGTLAWDVSPDTTVSFSYEHHNHDPRGSEWSAFPTFFSDGTPTNLPRNLSSAPSWAYWASKQDMALARVDHSFGNGWTANATLSGVTREYKAENTRFYGRPDPVTGLGMTLTARKADEFQRQIGLDAAVSGPVEAFGRSHFLNFGFQSSRAWTRANDWAVVGSQPAMGDYRDWDGSLARPDFYLPVAGKWKLGATQVSGIASAKISIADGLTAVVGARYTDWKSDTRHFAELTPYVGLVYEVTDGISVFASHTNIFKPQNYKDRDGFYLDPVQGKSDEIGVKGEWFDGRLNASLSAFRTYQDNVAVAEDGVFVSGLPNQQAYIGAMGQTARGVELEVSGEVRPGWNVFFGAATMKVKDATGVRTNTFLPDRTVKLFTTYNLPGDYSKWTVGGGMRWQSESWNNMTIAGRQIRNSQKPYGVVDAMVRYDLNEKWSAQLNVNNVFDKVYYHSASVAAVYGDPRNAMLTLTSRF